MTHFRSEPSWQRDNGTKNTAPLIDPLSIIYNEGQWKLYKVSPLYNLQTDAVKLKQYAAKIRQAIVSTVATNSSLKYTVVVDPAPHLRYSEDDPPGLSISVTCSAQEVNSKTKLAYTVLLLSWGVNTQLSNATHLPYMLERGENKVGAAVKTTLQTVFDCNIKQLLFSPYQLLQFGFNFIEYDTSREIEQFVLVFKPPDVDYKEKLTFSFDIGDIRIIWNGAKDEAEKPSDMVNLAYQIIQNQIMHMVTLDVSAFELTDISMPKGEVKASGIVKMKNAEIVNSVFTVLNEICSIHFVKEL
ncbi:kinetochore complex sim4 subunit fta1 domain-containing protein [Phthorimaea operculella]|nr:kinetochore complex sim4 subunit fta1 domain-containing protein [Phthorimaea operculella]